MPLLQKNVQPLHLRTGKMSLNNWDSAWNQGASSPISLTYSSCTLNHPTQPNTPCATVFGLFGCQHETVGLFVSHRFTLSMVSLGKHWNTVENSTATNCGVRHWALLLVLLRQVSSAVVQDRHTPFLQRQGHQSMPSLGSGIQLQKDVQFCLNCPVLSNWFPIVSIVFNGVQPPAMWIEAAFVQTLPFPGPSIEAIRETGSRKQDLQCLESTACLQCAIPVLKETKTVIPSPWWNCSPASYALSSCASMSVSEMETRMKSHAVLIVTGSLMNSPKVLLSSWISRATRIACNPVERQLWRDRCDDHWGPRELIFYQFRLLPSASLDHLEHLFDCYHPATRENWLFTLLSEAKCQ